MSEPTTDTTPAELPLVRWAPSLPFGMHGAVLRWTLLALLLPDAAPACSEVGS